jgi:hypothetical protein
VRTSISFLHVSPRLTVQVIFQPLSTSSHGKRICASVRWILLERDRLCLQHSAIFFSWTFPHKPLDTASFNCCIQFCLVKAGIQGLSPLPLRWPLAPCSAMSYVSAIGVMPRRTSISIMPFEVYYEYLGVGSHDFPRFRLLTSALSYQTRLPADRIGHLLVRR